MSISQTRQILHVTDDPAQFFAVIEDVHAPKNAWLWFEFAEAYGPYPSEAYAELVCEQIAGRPSNDRDAVTPHDLAMQADLVALLACARCPAEAVFDEETVAAKATVLRAMAALRTTPALSAGEARAEAARQLGMRLLALRPSEHALAITALERLAHEVPILAGVVQHYRDTSLAAALVEAAATTTPAGD